MARIMRQGTRHQKNFTLSKYGSWEKAEKAAARWVKQMLRELPPEAPRTGRMTARNSSGVVGVRADSGTSRRYHGGEWRTYENWRWRARWPGCPVRGGISWSVAEYGDDDAFVLAVLSRDSESVDRKSVLAKLSRIKGKPAYKKILAMKELEIV